MVFPPGFSSPPSCFEGETPPSLFLDTIGEALFVWVTMIIFFGDYHHFPVIDETVTRELTEMTLFNDIFSLVMFCLPLGVYVVMTSYLFKSTVINGDNVVVTRKISRVYRVKDITPEKGIRSQ